MAWRITVARAFPWHAPPRRGWTGLSASPTPGDPAAFTGKSANAPAIQECAAPAPAAPLPALFMAATSAASNTPSPFRSALLMCASVKPYPPTAAARSTLQPGTLSRPCSCLSSRHRSCRRCTRPRSRNRRAMGNDVGGLKRGAGVGEVHHRERADEQHTDGGAQVVAEFAWHSTVSVEGLENARARERAAAWAVTKTRNEVREGFCDSSNPSFDRPSVVMPWPQASARTWSGKPDCVQIRAKSAGEIVPVRGIKPVEKKWWAV